MTKKIISSHFSVYESRVDVSPYQLYLQKYVPAAKWWPGEDYCLTSDYFCSKEIKDIICNYSYGEDSLCFEVDEDTGFVLSVSPV